MTQRLFQTIPNIMYSNTLCKDITRRAKLIEDSKTSPFILLPYEIQHNLRSDQVSEYYYNNSNLDWMIYMVNGIVDPYYEWYLDDYAFEQLIIQKYGSIPNSMKRIKYFVNNWATDQNEVDASFYENNMALSWKKYYVPSVWKKSRSLIKKKNENESAVYTNVPLSYKRKEIDIFMNTNRIMDMSISADNNSKAIVIGELVDLKDVNGTSETVGTGEVIAANSSVIRIMHVLGNTTANSTFLKLMVGETSGANLTINNSEIALKSIVVNSVTQFVKMENIPFDEEKFWSPVSYYDYELSENEKRKHIVLPAQGAKDIMYQRFQQRLQENMDPVTRMTITE